MSQPSNLKPEQNDSRRHAPLGLPEGFAWRVPLILFLALALLGSLGVYAWFQPARSVSTITLARGDIRATVNANARVRAIRMVHLAFPLSGQLARVNVQEGDKVKAGDVLAEIKSDDLDRRVKQAEISLAARQLELDRAQAAPQAEELDIAQANLKKAALALGLAEDNAQRNSAAANEVTREVAQADYDIARANLDRLTRGPTDQDLQANKLAVNNAQLDLDNARQARTQAQLRAPFDGIVTEVNAQAGELIGGYNPVVGVADTTQLELLAEIDEIDVGSVASGQNVEIRFDAFPGETLSGKVVQVFPAASSSRGAMIYNARISFDPSRLGVRPGMGATVKIATIDKKGVWVLPTRAIKNAGSLKIVSAMVGGVLKNVVVETGLSDGAQTEILGGLQPGSQVVIE